ALPVVLVTAVGRAPGRTERSLAQAAALAAAGTAAPTSLPEGFADLRAELAGPGIPVVKRTWGAFHGTDLDERLRAEGVTQVVVVGIATSKGVESTARAAHEHGYHVALPVDAMTDGTLAAHDAAVATVFPEIGETTTTDELLALLDAIAPTTGSQAAAVE
ncbi:isochorismatase family protein, partial [Agromyces seonyuensis]